MVKSMNSDSFSNEAQTNPIEEQNLEIEAITHSQTQIYPEETRRGETDRTKSIIVGSKDEDWNNAELYLQSGEPVELKIIDQNRGGLIAALGQLRGFLPNSQIPELRNTSQGEQALAFKRRMIGTMLPLLIIEVDKERNRLICSAKTGQEDFHTHRLDGLSVGQTISGRIVNLVKFGAFVDIGRGINGLIHISELSWQRISHPSEVVSVGDEVTVKIQQIDPERDRINLSLKELQPNPWFSIQDRYKVGDLIEGVVTSVRPFGIFIELAAGVEGLLHQSEFSDDNLISSQHISQPGEKLLVRITSIQPDQQRIGLSLQQVTMEEQLTWLMHKDSIRQLSDQQSVRETVNDDPSIADETDFD